LSCGFGEVLRHSLVIRVEGKKESKKMALATAAKRLVPLLDRVLVEKIVPPTKTAGGILLPETSTKVSFHIALWCSFLFV
jgi:hypothetical protein